MSTPADFPPELLRAALNRKRDRLEVVEIELAHWRGLFGENALDRIKAHIMAAGAEVEEAGRQRLREALEDVLVLEYDPAEHGNLNDWAAEQIRWLDAERLRHADQVTEIHKLLREAGHGCARWQVQDVIARLLTERRGQ